MKHLFVVFGLSVAMCGCGVRGDPRPPLTPAELGRGQPTFKRTTEEFAFPEVPNPDAGPLEATPSPSPKPSKSRSGK